MTAPEQVTAIVSPAFHDLYTSPDFLAAIHDDWLPWLFEELGPGRDLIDLEAGPGFALDSLRSRFERIAAARAAPDTAHPGTGQGPRVEIIDVDPTRLPFPDDHFDAATAILSLHHLPSGGDQDQALREMIRVVRPGGAIAGLNAIDGPHFRRLDTSGSCTPIDPMGFPNRLRNLGLLDVNVTIWSFVRFIGRVLGPGAAPERGPA